ncbi:serine/threonine-protein kinase pim-2-like [Danio aesculapii]|uniref:serine/threonine-protein kinase pim-2-like n=1 Tax=Danio aesculapii TaxID=1142201 RepID=UPI0024C0C94B|nr:serine/threonine-protein kinase pim-2-like [Danio aesculapii]
MEMFLFVFFILEKPKKGRKGKRVSAFFKRVWKAAKRPLLCCDTDIVQHLTPQPEPELKPESEPEVEDEADPEAVSVEVMPEIAEPADPESVCLPGQVPEEPKEASGLTRGFDLSNFEVEHMIGEGAFGQVYVASHKLSKSEKVALKFIKKREQDRYFYIDGHSTPVLAEVAIMLRLMNAPQCPNIIGLHDWVENKNNFILSLEFAESCQTLDQYITDTFDINENQARRLLRQLIRAVKFCVKRGVFHGDIHTENILVTKPQLELKLIDFGCAWPVTRKPLNSSQYRGAILCTPPEVFRHRIFHANPVNVWTIGIVLYEILHGDLPFHDKQSIMFGSIETHPRLSTACQDLFSQCFIRCPLKRLQLHQLEKHQWFNPTIPNPVQQLDKRR